MKEEVCVAVPIYKRRLNPFEEVGYRRLFEVLGHYPIYGFMARGLEFEAPAGTPGTLRRLELAPRHLENGEAYSRFLCSTDFYEAFSLYRYVLVHQLDCYVFRDELREWCGRGYDFIGAPIFEGFFPEDPSRVEAFVGNGGLSLRRVDACQRVLKSRRSYRPQRPFWREATAIEPVKAAKRLLMAAGIFNGVQSCAREHGEDIFWSRHARHFVPEFNVAPVREGFRFSWDYAPAYCHVQNEGRLPFGCHAWERYDLKFLRQFIPISDEVAAHLTQDMRGPKPFRPVAIMPGGPLAAANVRKAGRRLSVRTLRRIRFGLDDQLLDQVAFNRLGRRPPELMWKACARCPRVRVEAGQALIGDRLYVMGGYEMLDSVVNVVDVFDLRRGRWVAAFAMPAGMAQTHVGIDSDNARYIYAAGGQLGPRCAPSVAACHALDTATNTWADIPPLPHPCYAPVLRLWRGRLHAVGGTMPDRGTPTCEHWSIAVSAGHALEDQWRPEIPIPVPGTHRGGAIIDDALYVFGGHSSDIRPYPGDPQYTCDWSSEHETTLGNAVRLDPGGKEWKQLAPMPTASGHNDYSVVKTGPYVLIVAGVTAHNIFHDLIQCYDTQTDQWKAAGRLPFAMKTNAVYHNGWIYIVTGQRARGADDPRPGSVVNGVWRARYDPARISP
jgi:hypothetical protein